MSGYPKTREPDPKLSLPDPTRQEFLTSGKTRPDPKPETKPAGTRIWKKATISTTTSNKIRVKNYEYLVLNFDFLVKLDWKYVLDRKLREKSDSQDFILKFNQIVVLNSLPESNPKPPK